LIPPGSTWITFPLHTAFFAAPALARFWSDNMRIWFVMASLALSSSFLAPDGTRLTYPETRTVEQTDDYFGTKVTDPYRWLEDDNSPDTAAWVAAENKVTFAYLEKIPARAQIRRRITELWDYARYGVPSKEGPFYIYTKNDGLQNQSVLYKATALNASPEVLLDPNLLSSDGTVALAGASFSEDGKYLAYATSASGSDWMEWHVREVATAKDLPDLIKWSKFSGAAWKKDGSGFYYSRYDAPKPGEELAGVNKNQKVYFHKVGTSQDADPLVYERPDQPDWGFSADVTDDGRYLLIYQSQGTERENRIFVQDLQKPDSKIEPFLDKFDASYQVVGNDGDRFYVKTDKDAPRGRLVAMTHAASALAPEASAWTSIIPEGPKRDVLSEVSMSGPHFIATWRTDAHEQLKVYGLRGAFERDIPLPTLGSVGSVSTKRKLADAFYAFTSYTYPTTIYHYDVAKGASQIFKQPKVAFSPDDYETHQVFYPSKDGTRIPMFLTYKKGLARTGQNPTMLYGYGGFDISLTPSFAPQTIAWLEMGGIYAVANLRGGGEYGKEWHDAGRLTHKQNVFDDFIAAAEYLIAEKYTSTPKLAISGGSNGGLLVGACLTQRPDLFGATLPAVGVMDMLRFHKFTIGWAWKSDYASSETKEGFDTLIKYSPLHNIKPGTKYPPTLVTTADHDDRVVPAHSFKFAATLQAAQAGDAPVLIRIETKAGHGAGKPTSKLIEERADMYAFLVQVLHMDTPDAKKTQ
jgi:prolyl oligopeptidase